MSTNPQEQMMEKLLELMGAQALKHQGRTREDISHSNDKDTYQTGLKKFSSATMDVFNYVDSISGVLSSWNVCEDDKKDILLERLSVPDYQRLSSRVQLASLNYEQIKLECCKAFKTEGQSESFEKDFRELKQGNLDIQTHFENTTKLWRAWILCKIIEEKPKPMEEFFLSSFLDSLQNSYGKGDLRKQIKVTKRVTDIHELGTYILNSRVLFTPDTNPELQYYQEQSTKLIAEHIGKLNQKQKVFDKEKEEIKSSLQNVQTVQTEMKKQMVDDTTKMQEINSKALQDAKAGNTKMYSELCNLRSMMNGMNEDRENSSREAEKHKHALEKLTLLNNIQLNRNSHINPQRYSNTDYNDRGRSQERDNRYNPYNRDKSQERDNKQDSYNRGRTRERDGNYNRNKSPSPHRDRDRSRTRSPSPLPGQACYLCNGDHWQIKCPLLSRMERELELYKILEKAKKQGRHTPALEEDMRSRNSIPKGRTNKHHTNDLSAKAQGQGFYCKWCHTKGHSTWHCRKYCPLCENDGHGWKDCNSTAAKQIIEARNDNTQFGINLQKFSSY